jgi:hypothetical protein
MDGDGEIIWMVGKFTGAKIKLYGGISKKMKI